MILDDNIGLNLYIVLTTYYMVIILDDKRVTRKLDKVQSEEY